MQRVRTNSLFRYLLTVLVVLLAIGLLAACGAAAPAEAPAEAPAAGDDATAEEAADEGGDMEAPMLAEMVAAGELPPVEERLPANPLVVEAETLGEYGGTWRTALVGGQDTAWLRRTISYDYLMRWDPQWTTVVPNIPESVDANEDASQYTFHLREGMKWSDGEPFTAHDIAFWWNDVILNEQVSPGGAPTFMKAGESDATVEAIDDYTVVFTFSAPNGLFLQHLATPDGWLPTRYPKHYLSQFHADYNTENLDELIEEAGATDWVNLFELKGHGVQGAPIPAVYQNSDLPTLWPFKFTVPYGEGTQVVAERNPYYWKVDTEGRQLPYLDKVVYEILEDREVLLLKVLNGEIDMMSRHFNTNDNKAVLADSMEAGEYGFFETRNGGNSTGLHFNLNHKDPRMREIFQNKDFRIGISHCINRQEVVDLLFIGQGEPMASAMDKNSIPELYDEEMYNQYIEFDPDLAHEHFAAAGMEMGDDGFFLGPDGEELSFVIQSTDSFGHSDRAELVGQQLQACGVNAQVKIMDRSLLYALKDANDHDVHVWGAGGSSSVFLDPRHFLPYSQESAFAEAWATWYNPPAAGAQTEPEEPPDIVKHQMELYDQIKRTGDLPTQIELMKEIIEIAKDQFYVIGLTTEPPGYGIVRNNFHNVPESMPGSWQYPTPAPTNPETYWIEQ